MRQNKGGFATFEAKYQILKKLPFPPRCEAGKEVKGLGENILEIQQAFREHLPLCFSVGYNLHCAIRT